MRRQVRRYSVARLRADVLQVVSSLWHNFQGGFSHRLETAASIASTTTNRCRPIPPLCISPAVWRLSLRLTLRSTGVARGKFETRRAVVRVLFCTSPTRGLRSTWCLLRTLHVDRSMIIAGTSFCIGAVCQASAKNTFAPLFLGRIFWGIGKFAVHS